MDDLLQLFEEARFGKEAQEPVEPPAPAAPAAPAPLKPMTPAMRQVRDALERSVANERRLRRGAVERAEFARSRSADADMAGLGGKLVDVGSSYIPGMTEGGDGILNNQGAQLAAGAAGGLTGGLVGAGVLPGMRGYLERKAQNVISGAGEEVQKAVDSNLKNLINRGATPGSRLHTSALADAARSAKSPITWTKRMGVAGALAAMTPFAISNFMKNRRIRASGGQEAIDARKMAERYLQRAEMQGRWRKAQLSELGVPTAALQGKIEPCQLDLPSIARAMQSSGADPRLVDFKPFTQHQRVNVDAL